MNENIMELSEKMELELEKNLILFFPAPHTEWIPKLIPYQCNVILNPLLGEHLGIVTDRRIEGFMTNRDFNGERKDYFFSNDYESSWRPYLRKLILNRVYAQFPNLEKPIMIIEHPASNFAADIISDCLPNSKIIILVNDGRNYVERQVSSLLRNKKIKEGLKSFSPEQKIPFIEQQSKRWNKMMNIMLALKKTHPSKKLKIIKMEDILSSKESLGNIYEFLGIEIDEKTLNQIKNKIENEYRKNKIKNFIGNWRNTFSDKEKEVMEKILKNILIDLEFK